MKKLFYDTTEEVKSLFEGGDYNLSKMILNTILENIDETEGEFLVVSISTGDSDVNYDIMVSPEDYLEGLETNLPAMEEEEDYDMCSKTFKAINYLKSK
jgi:hypothetical protein